MSVLAVLAPLLGPTAPAQAAGPDSWAHVWDREQTVSTSHSSTFKFPYQLECPANFHVAVSWIKWGYSSPEGSTVRLRWLKLRLRPNHRLRVTIDGLNRYFPAREYTTRRFDIDTSKDFPLLAWDGGDAVGVHIGNGQNTPPTTPPATPRWPAGASSPSTSRVSNATSSPCPAPARALPVQRFNPGVR